MMSTRCQDPAQLVILQEKSHKVSLSIRYGWSIIHAIRLQSSCLGLYLFSDYIIADSHKLVNASVINLTASAGR